MASTRRRFLQHLAATLALAPSLDLLATTGTRSNVLLRPVPSSGERLPVIGMGSYITFDVGDDPALIAQRTEVLRAFFAAGGTLIDSSPMYGTAEAALGLCLQNLAQPPVFAATKIWHFLESGGMDQMRRSFELWQVPRLDLLQVHNLLSWHTQLETIRAARDEGRVRYVGITTSHGRRHDELIDLMRREPLDFVQITYNILDREVEERILPLAADRGIAVIVNRPFRRGALIDRYQDRPLPDWAGDIDCDTWPRFLLAFIVSHPAVTCAIPATSRVDHMVENMAVLSGPLPDAAMRKAMIKYVQAL
jgi:diketogulonate reductase-like aldo/keto reductase